MLTAFAALCTAGAGVMSYRASQRRKARPEGLAVAASPTPAHGDVATYLLHMIRDDPHIHASNPRAVHTALTKLIAGGTDQFAVVADFDRTITGYRAPTGAQGLSCHGMLESSKVLSPDYARRAQALFEQSFPIETHARMTIEEKIPYMIRWYSDGHAALSQERLTKRILHDAVTRAVQAREVGLRPCMGELLTTAVSHRVPTTVFSAGIADVLHVFLQVTLGEELIKPIRIVSNQMAWDENGVHCGWATDLVHMFNKDEQHIPPSARATHRPNVLLMGDSTGDVTMASGQEHQVCLKVGFCNANVRALLPRYMQLYDIVITHDEPALWPLLLVQAICGEACMSPLAMHA